MTHTIQRESDKVQLSDRDERARRAVKTFRSMQPMLSAFARVLTRDPKVRVEMSATSNGMTDGRKIYFRPPIKLGDKLDHVRKLCDKRDDTLQQQCPACAVREEVLSVIFHEISHIAFDSFARVTDEDKTLALRASIAATGTKYAKKIEAKIAGEPSWGYNQISALISKYLPMIINALEDSRIELASANARKGTRLMFQASTYRVFTEGFEAVDDEGGIKTVLWSEAPLDSQVTVGLYVKAAKYGDYTDWFHADVVTALDDSIVTDLCNKIATAKKVSDVWHLTFPILARLRELGFFRDDYVPEDEEDDPSEEAGSDGTDSSKSEPSDDSEGDEGGDDSDESSGDADSDDESDGSDSSARSGGGDPSGEGDESEFESFDDSSDDRSSGRSPESSSDESDPTEKENELDEGEETNKSSNSASDQSSDPDAKDRFSERSLDNDDNGERQESDGNDADGQEEEGDRIDPGADDGTGGITAEGEDDSEGGLPHGDPDEAAAALVKWLGHEEKPTSVQMKKDDHAVDKAIIQGIYFETPSVHVHGVREHRYGQPQIEGDFNYSQAWEESPWHGFSSRRTGREGDFSPPESIMGPALLKTRRAFTDNARGKHQTNLKSGKVNANVLGKRAHLGDERLFHQRRHPGKRDYFVLIMMDVSGSTAGENIYIMKQAVMAQADLLQRTGVKFAIYAQSGQRHTLGYNPSMTTEERMELDLEIYIIKEASDPWDKNTQKALSDIGPDSANLDGHALEYARKHVEESQATDRIILYYSDGRMPAENHDEELEILQREIRYCRSHNIMLLGVGIRTDSPARHGLETVQLNSVDETARVVEQLGKHLARRSV